MKSWGHTIKSLSCIPDWHFLRNIKWRIQTTNEPRYIRPIPMCRFDLCSSDMYFAKHDLHRAPFGNNNHRAWDMCRLRESASLWHQITECTNFWQGCMNIHLKSIWDCIINMLYSVNTYSSKDKLSWEYLLISNWNITSKLKLSVCVILLWVLHAI